MKEPPPANITKLLQDLQSEDAFQRKTAAEELGKLKVLDEQAINALMSVATSDSNKYVKQAATEALTVLGYQTSFVPTDNSEEPVSKPSSKILQLLSWGLLGGFGGLVGILILLGISGALEGGPGGLDPGVVEVICLLGSGIGVVGGFLAAAIVKVINVRLASAVNPTFYFIAALIGGAILSTAVIAILFNG